MAGCFFATILQAPMPSNGYRGSLESWIGLSLPFAKEW